MCVSIVSTCDVRPCHKIRFSLSSEWFWFEHMNSACLNGLEKLCGVRLGFWPFEQRRFAVGVVRGAGLTMRLLGPV